MPEKIRGIYYEPARGRYRVRLYHDNRVVHRSYHKTWREALRAWRKAKATPPPPPIPERPHVGPDLGDLMAHFK